MRLLDLTVHNWGVFRGPHHFEFAPLRQPDGAYRHLSIVSGHNGAGKSTLFQAIVLALQGSLILGNGASRQAYNDYLSSHMHHHSQDGTSITSDKSSIALSLYYVEAGRPSTVRIERGWGRNGSSIVETLSVLQDDRSPDIDPTDYQIWLNDIVSPGIIPLCFFDAEKMDALASPEHSGKVLGGAVRRLLGLDLVERLRADLEQFASRRGKRQEVKHLREQVLQCQSTLDTLNAKLDQLLVEAERLSAEEANLKATLDKQERRLAAEGGSYAARRPVLQERLTTVQEEMGALSEQLRELGAGLLPFALVPELCQSLGQRLAKEAELHRQQIAQEFWQERIAGVEAFLQGDDFWQGADLPIDVRRSLARRVTSALKEVGLFHTGSDGLVIHQVAQPEHGQLQDWITQARYAVPQQVHMLGNRLRELKTEQRRIEVDLQRVPDEAVLAPIHAEIMRSSAALADTKARQRTLDERIGALQFQRDEQVRQLGKAAEELGAAQANERHLALAEGSKLALRAYQDALIRQRLEGLERALVTAFNTVCYKEHLLTEAHIDLQDFRILLRSADGRDLRLGDFSAGEWQLYALALFWALRKISGKRLPLIMDTPLARLDAAYRLKLVHDYIPVVSDQVILFATDTEIDEELLAEMEPYLSHVYRLNYDSNNGETHIAGDGHPDSLISCPLVPEGVESTDANSSPRPPSNETRAGGEELVNAP